ncbi:hypothetical protein KBA63_04870 [Candidatus Woesebacteria bacterium]|nr:hypothetical protein [Candidatus Woesebacteria bacterium]MBP9687565.1 hypothetical protein [Candidatus Woesebacteria bacterium]
MAYHMTLSGNYGTHLAPLIQAVNKTDGDILEIGLGIFSTPYLHYQSFLSKRNLTSIDNVEGWVNRFKSSHVSGHMYEGPYHKLITVNNWNEADIEKPWDVVLIDHSPSERRIEEVKRLANLAKYIIIHDSNPRKDREYHYSQIYPLFKYRTDWTGDANPATVLSNFVDLKDFWE